jgi:hypothetical protein
MTKPLSILDIALAKGAKQDERGGINMGEFDRLDLPFFSGCQHCHASLGPYNAFPSTTGFIQCRDCIEGDGFATVAAFDAFMERKRIEEEERALGGDPYYGHT